MTTTANTVADAELDIATFARNQADAFGRAIGKPRPVAARKLRAITQAFFDAMEVDEEQRIPLRSESGGLNILVIKKVGPSRFQTKTEAMRPKRPTKA